MRCWTADERDLSLRRNAMNLNESVRREVMSSNERRCTLRRDIERSCAANEAAQAKVTRADSLELPWALHVMRSNERN
jgi:hypothetical protein